MIKSLVATVAEDASVISVMLGILSGIVTVIILLVRNGKMATTAARESTAANQAVNNIGPGEGSLRDHITHIRKDIEKLTKHQEEFMKQGWLTMPNDMGTAAAFTATIRVLQKDNEHIKARVEYVAEAVETLKWDGITERRLNSRATNHKPDRHND